MLARVPRRPRRPLPEPEVPAGAKDPRIVLGERVNALRVALGLSQEDFAGRVGLDRTYVSGIERGLRNPTLLVLLRLAQALEVPVTELLEETQERKGERPPAKR
ncbi:helix-turn-helix domain-containing protein [Roseomonas gilardii]|uniref:helix-turn-helix domain-containing protein n=1 Tax=Roseomonas gilardii TaxID=257708 RepID=UPI003003341F